MDTATKRAGNHSRDTPDPMLSRAAGTGPKRSDRCNRGSIRTGAQQSRLAGRTCVERQVEAGDRDFVTWPSHSSYPVASGAIADIFGWLVLLSGRRQLAPPAVVADAMKVCCPPPGATSTGARVLGVQCARGVFDDGAPAVRPAPRRLSRLLPSLFRQALLLTWRCALLSQCTFSAGDHAP